VDAVESREETSAAKEDDETPTSNEQTQNMNSDGQGLVQMFCDFIAWLLGLMPCGK
jgi:hypothetical protein